MRHDPQIKAVLGAYKHPLMRATWVLDPDGCKPKVVQHVADDLGVGILGNDKGQGAARRRGVVWTRHLQEAFNYLVFGHMPFERRYTYDAQGVPHLTHLGARMPWTIAQMKIDQFGIMQEVVQTTQRDPIPAERFVWYVNDQEGSNWAGISMLRAAFGAWLLKHETWRVHVTSIRRFGMGVPVVNAPPGATQAQVIQAQQLASSMRAGDSAGMGLPQGFSAAIQGIAGSIPDALGFIKYLDIAMAKMVHAGLIELGQTDNGSRALGETFMDLFQLALQSVADSIAMTATSGYEGMPGIITDLVDQAYGEDEPAPRLVCTDVGENYEVSANALQSLTMSGVMTPDPALDEWARKTWRLPKRTDKWTPSSRGMPAGDSITPKTENALGYDGVPGAGGGQGPARDTTRVSTPQNGGQSTSDGTQAQPAASRRISAEDGTRRQQEYIQASSWEPGQHQDDWEQALAHLLLQYRSVMSAQRTDLVDRVITAMESGQQQNLVLAAPAVGNGPDLVTRAMVSIARKAAQAMVDEAERQGVHIDLEQVRVDADALGGTAQARSLFYSGWMAQQATAKALQVYGPTPEGMLRAADEVDRFLASLSDATLRDQLGAALTTAQNAGRFAVLKAAPQSAGHKVTYVASEFLDKNTCLAPFTRVTTRRGQVRADEVRLSDRLLTHAGRWVQPSAITVSEVDEDLVRLDLDGRALTVTHDHPVLVLKDGALTWQGAGQLVPGDLMVSETAAQGCRELRVPDLGFRQSPDGVPPGGKVRRLAAVHMRAEGVPVGSVCLDDQFSAQEVNGPRADLRLRRECVPSAFKDSANGTLDAGFGTGRPVAASGAVAPLALLGRDNTKRVAAVTALDKYGRATARLTAVAPDLGLGVTEPAAAAHAVCGTSASGAAALLGAVRVPGSVRDGNGEVCAALRAGLGYPVAGAAHPGPYLRVGPLALLGAVDGPAHSERSTASPTYPVHKLSVSEVRTITAVHHAGYVYDFTIPGDSTFCAAGVIVHNCDHCRHEDGSEFDTIEAAEAAYPTGGFRECQGLLRCRGTVVAVWGPGAPTPGSGVYPYKSQVMPAASAGDADPKVPSTAGGLTAKFDPLEKRGPNGEWLGDLTRTGRKAEQTPSQFTHPMTGHRMGKSEIGDTFEELFKNKGAGLLEKKYGGAFKRVSGEGGPRNTPLDFMLDDTFGGELKTLNAGAANQKTAIKKDEILRKEQAVAVKGVKPLLVVQVVSPKDGSVQVYSFPAFASKTTRAMTHLGSYSFGPDDFKQAQEATGHWDKRVKRAKEQGLG